MAQARRTANSNRGGAKSSRSTALTVGAGLALAAGAALVGIFARRRQGIFGTGNAEHQAPDLALDAPRPGPDDRAPDAFRPDPTAPVPASEREALRPPSGSPSMTG